MPPVDLRKFRVPLRLIAAILLCSLVYRWASTHASPTQHRGAKVDICRFALVNGTGRACLATTTSPLSRSQPCFWDLHVVSTLKQIRHSLHVRKDEELNVVEVKLLQRLDGCNSTAECKNETVACTYGIEDPSDALWLRDYNNATKFVVIFRVGLASLAFFIVSMISDGSIFYPHRSGFSVFFGSLFVLIGISSLLYILLIPQSWQLSLYGSGPLQSIGFLLIVTSIAGMLPAVAIIWVNFMVFLVFFLGFLVEQLAYMFIGIMHFLGMLSLYQAENTLLYLRLFYTREVMEEVEFNRRLVNISERFLTRVRGNWYLRRVPVALEEEAIHIVGIVQPDHLLEEVMQEDVPQVDFESTEDRNEDGTNSGRQSTHNDEATPLLQRNSNPQT